MVVVEEPPGPLTWRAAALPQRSSAAAAILRCALRPPLPYPGVIAPRPPARPHGAAMAGGGRDGGGGRRRGGGGHGPAMALRGPLMAAAGGGRLLAARGREHGSVRGASGAFYYKIKQLMLLMLKLRFGFVPVVLLSCFFLLAGKVISSCMIAAMRNRRP